MVTAPSAPLTLFALVDCNNFYVSCERVFEPKLRGKPVVVLSNNDGCAVSRSQEAKDLGIKMGVPWFQIAHLAKASGLIAKSSNYALYAAMSNRVMAILRDMAPRQEVYSVDESFLDLTGVAEPVVLSRQIKQRVLQWTHIPVCVGLGSTKTRAKLANHVAKKSRKSGGVFNLESLSHEQQQRLLHKIDVGEVWGVGRRLSQRLARLGIFTVNELQQADPELIRDQFGVVLSRTLAELNGISCLSLDEVSPRKQQIVVSRSFGTLLTTCAELEEAIVSHATRAAEKLRKDGSAAQLIQVFAHTNSFRESDAQYYGTRTVPLAAPTQDSRKLVAAAIQGLRALFRPGYLYKKCGVMLSGLSDCETQQCDLFNAPDSSNSRRLMQTLDAVNRRYGRGAAFFAGAGIGHRPWTMQREMMSPAYMTDWQAIKAVRS